jgi:hypothetical protein
MRHEIPRIDTQLFTGRLPRPRRCSRCSGKIKSRICSTLCIFSCHRTRRVLSSQPRRRKIHRCTLELVAARILVVGEGTTTGPPRGLIRRPILLTDPRTASVPLLARPLAHGRGLDRAPVCNGPVPDPSLCFVLLDDGGLIFINGADFGNRTEARRGSASDRREDVVRQRGCDVGSEPPALPGDCEVCAELSSVFSSWSPP